MSRLVLVAALCASAVGCTESKYDVYMRGLKLEGDAERGPCKLHYAEGEHAARLDRSQLTACLLETDKALAEYEKAKALGYDEPDFNKVHQRAIERRARLVEMIEMVGEMQRDAVTAELPGGR